MLGAPLAPVIFPRADRPSACFVGRFEQDLRTLPSDILPAPLQLAFDGCVEDDFAACLASLGPLSAATVVSFGSGQALVAIPDSVADALTEFAFGGDGSESMASGRGATPTGRRYADRIIAMLVAAIDTVLPDYGVVMRGATARPGDVMPPRVAAMACGFGVEACGTALGAIGLIVPIETLANIENAAGGSKAPDQWSSRLERASGQARVTVRAVLARPTLTAGEVARLKPGAVIPIPSLSEVALIANGYRIASGTADASDGRAAIVITRTEFSE